MNYRREKWGAFLSVLMALSCATGQPTTRPADQSHIATPVALTAAPGEKETAPIPDDIRPADADPTRAQILNLLKAGPGENERSSRIREALSSTLDVKPIVAGVKPQRIQCTRRLCAADVYYATAADFRDFDDQTVRSPESPFNKWEGSNGHTGLLRAKDKRLLATWYFFALDSGMPSQVRTHLIDKSDKVLKQARENPPCPVCPAPPAGPKQAAMKEVK
jgi:hypothetical protein